MSDFVECPHCGHLIRDLWDYCWNGDEDEERRDDCGNCEEPIAIKRHVDVVYSIRKDEP